MKNIIDKILLNVCLDERIENGLVDFTNETHLRVLAENLFENGMNGAEVANVMTNITLQDGKYPDRQAFNKEGWLVTFPSPVYKMAAIKKGTHYETDPTYGKGGMNLYYKGKGKQARKKQQDVSAIDTNEPQQKKQPTVVKPIVSPETPRRDVLLTPTAPTQKAATPAPVDDKVEEPGKTDASDVAAPVAKTVTDTPSKNQDISASVDIAPERELEPEKAFDMPENFVELTKQFAISKNWKENEENEWYDESGQTAAITAIDREVVPVEYKTREELRSYISKNDVV